MQLRALISSRPLNEVVAVGMSAECLEHEVAHALRLSLCITAVPKRNSLGTRNLRTLVWRWLFNEQGRGSATLIFYRSHTMIICSNLVCFYTVTLELCGVHR